MADVCFLHTQFNYQLLSCSSVTHSAHSLCFSLRFNPECKGLLNVYRMRHMVLYRRITSKHHKMLHMDKCICDTCKNALTHTQVTSMEICINSLSHPFCDITYLVTVNLRASAFRKRRSYACACILQCKPLRR